MKLRVATSSLPVLMIMAGLATAPAARGAEDSAARTVSATHLATAEVARVDARTGRLTLRTEGRMVTVDRDAESPSIRGLRAGAPILVGYRVERDARGRERRFLVALHENTPGPAVRAASSTTTVITGQRTARVSAVPSAGVDWAITGGSPVAVAPAPVQPWTATAAPPAAGGIPLSYVTDSIASVPVPTPAPNMALPPSGAAMVDSADARVVVAARDFQMAAAQLAQAADTMDRAWQGHVNLCVPGVSATTARDREWFRLYDGDLPQPDRDDCRAQREELNRMAQRFRDQLLNATATAQAGGLLPGQVRDVLVRSRINL
jgi:hypothetical protein